MSEKNKPLPPIPEKHYFTIGEVANICMVKPHVLRYWEQELPQLKPIKRRGNRRYYRYKDVVLVRKIYDLLYRQGYTINGAKLRIFAEQAQMRHPERFQHFVQEAILELKNIQQALDTA